MVYSPVESTSRDDPTMSVKPFDQENDAGTDDDTVKFIQEKFKKTCCAFRESDSNPSVCLCGYDKSKHTDRGIETDDGTKLVPTDAFGEVEFVVSGQKICKYICVDYQTKDDDLMDLMLKHWSMEKPNLLISVTGGAQNFTMKPRLRDVFRQGLVKAAESTRAWIITGGTNAGVMKHVGEALRDYAIKQGSRKQLVALGIATWGCIENRDDLISPKDKNGNATGHWPASYRISESSAKSKESPLDPNHTHFILVDNGTQQKFGIEIGLRTRLESRISKMKTIDESVMIPVVCVVLEGGPNTLETVKNAIDAGTPAIIVAGSGRAADILANAYDKCSVVETDSGTEVKYDESLWKDVEREIKEQFKKTDQKFIDDRVEMVKACIKKIDYLTVFRLDGESSAKDIDVAILRALLKVNRGKRINQMRLALAWDRVDVAKDEIFVEGVSFEENDLMELMYSALLNDRVEFVKLFLDKGLDLKDFLTKDRLCKLYNNVTYPLTIARCRQLQRKTEKRAITLKDIGSLIKEHSGELFEPKGYITNEQGAKSTVNIEMAIRDTNPIAPREHCVSDEPCRDLFLWSVLTQRQKLAMVFWYEGKEDLSLAVVAHLLQSSLLAKDPEPELNQDLLKQVTFYEDLAIGFLSECHSSDQRKTIQLLVREIPAFGKTTVLKMAVQADNKNFVAHPACQSLLTEVWTGKLSDDNHYIKLLFTTFCFFLAPLLLKYREKEVKQTNDRSIAYGSLYRPKRESTADLLNGQVNTKTTGQPDSPSNSVTVYFQKLLFFFQAPVVKFCYNCMSYFAFLLLFGVILLTDFYPTIGIKEQILIAWVITLLFEEIRQIAMDDAGEIRWKLYNYITDVWNVIDVITIVTFLAGMVLRFIPVSYCGQCFFAARIVLALNFMTFFFRILHMFSIHRELGPKLVMIGKMMIDLFYFMIILLVFIAAYGIASHVILYPNQPLNIELARDVLSRSWWNIFGELGLDEVSGASCVNNTGGPHDPEQCASLEYDEFTSSDCTGYKADTCPPIGWLVPIVLAIYVLITNVLMLNLLIAMFSNTFANIQGQTNVIWKMQRYHLVREYATRPYLPPPLIVLAHVFLLIRHFCCQNSNRCLKSPSKFRFSPSQSQDKELLYWENVNAEEFLRKRDCEDENGDERKTKDSNDKLELILRKVEEIYETIPAIEKRLEELEKHIRR